MLEHKSKPVLSPPEFAIRMGKMLLIALALIGASLAIGIVGYMHFVQLSFVDAFLEAAMILGGMGPVAQMPNDAAKLFAGFYALYSGLMIIGIMGVVLGPVVHRVLHVFHVDTDDVKKAKK